MTLHQHAAVPVPGTLGEDTTTRLLWLDFETNCLHDRGYEVHVLEVAAVVTDASLDQLAVFEPMVIRAPESAYESMDDYVRTMHTTNGLLAESRASTTTVEEADAALADFVTK
ncbi:hypothetical protein [Nesterenkonia sp. HG001]|uniref:hypothetical protein n=1 Tax=Nesterenkonia sp. HG001 TaxID=2983207 RepID=UPI002AC76096|nr:hypothetical protein [Nesterenkonia sp. HG001]MDZ5077842.1 hypothetical protein [Nesterenkonia sp. HG001]